MPSHAAAIEHQQPCGQCLTDAAQQFQRFGRLHGADNANQRRKYAHGGATRFFQLV